jgi:hypothetical protein
LVARSPIRIGQDFVSVDFCTHFLVAQDFFELDAVHRLGLHQHSGDTFAAQQTQPLLVA